jgi:hypothetical protein
LKPEFDASNHLADSLSTGQPSLTTRALGKNSRTFIIQTPYGPIGLTVPASFPQIDITHYPDGFKLSFPALTSMEKELLSKST